MFSIRIRFGSRFEWVTGSGSAIKDQYWRPEKRKCYSFTLGRTGCSLWRAGNRWSQRDVVYLGWLRAPSYVSPNAGGWGGGVARSQPMTTAVHMEPNKPWDLTPYLTYSGHSSRRSQKNIDRVWIKTIFGNHSFYLFLVIRKKRPGSESVLLKKTGSDSSSPAPATCGRYAAHGIAFAHRELTPSPFLHA